MEVETKHLGNWRCYVEDVHERQIQLLQALYSAEANSDHLLIH